VLDDVPAMRVLRAGALVVSGGGYSAWHEARALGVPALFLPRPRSWDDQHLRVAGSDPPTTPEALEAAIERGLRGHASAAEIGLPDGADAVAARVMEALA
jgi:hypothetical protein